MHACVCTQRMRAYVPTSAHMHTHEFRFHLFMCCHTPYPLVFDDLYALLCPKFAFYLQLFGREEYASYGMSSSMFYVMVCFQVMSQVVSPVSGSKPI